MMFLKSWLFSVMGTAFLVSIADAMTPEKRVQKVGHLVGGLLLILALLQPMLRLQPETANHWLEELDFSRAEAREQEYREEAETRLLALIKEEGEAYIESAAEALGLRVRAAVEAEYDQKAGVRITETSVNIPYHAELSGQIERELGVAADRQHWIQTETG